LKLRGSAAAVFCFIFRRGVGVFLPGSGATQFPPSILAEPKEAIEKCQDKSQKYKIAKQYMYEMRKNSYKIYDISNYNS
jgi:hypothetical protein